MALDWPVITATGYVPIGGTGAVPVREGVGQDGREIGYLSGAMSEPAFEQAGISHRRVEFWLRLNPCELRRILARYDEADASEERS